MSASVVATSSSAGLAARLARSLGADLLLMEEKTFPDGECYVRVPARPSPLTVLVHTTYPDQDRRLVQLFLAVEALKGAGVDRLVLAVPYLAYARQDRRFLEGEPVSVGAVLRTLEGLGVDALVTVDVHKPESLHEWLRIPHANVLPIRELAAYLGSRVEDPVVVAPDRGALHRAEAMARALNAEYDYLEKARDRVTGEVTVKPKEVDVAGRDVVIVDDIISTGGTIALAAKSLSGAGPRRVYVACTHALLVAGALDKIYWWGVEEVVATDTVASPVSKVSVAGPLSESVKALMGRL